MRSIAERLADAEAWADETDPEMQAIARRSALRDWLLDVEGSPDVPAPDDMRAAVRLMADLLPDRLASLLTAHDEHPPRLVGLLRAWPREEWTAFLLNGPRSVRVAVARFLAQTSPPPLPD